MGVNEELIHKRTCSLCKGEGKIYLPNLDRWTKCPNCEGNKTVIVNTENPS